MPSSASRNRVRGGGVGGGDGAAGQERSGLRLMSLLLPGCAASHGGAPRCLSSISLCLVRRRQRGCAQPTNPMSREHLLDDILGLHALHPLPNGSILLPWASSHSNGLHPRRRDARDPSNHVFHLVGGSLLTCPRLSRFCCTSALVL